MVPSGLSARVPMQILKWTGIQSNDWFKAGNWSPLLVPSPGDTLIVQSGTPTVGENERVLGEQIILGGLSSGSAVTLVAENGATFEPDVVGTTIDNLSLTVTGTLL